MNQFKQVENFLNRMIDSCAKEDIKLERELRTIYWLYKKATNNDLRCFIQYNSCANDETISKEIKP